MIVETETSAVQNADPRIRETVNACWNCRHKYAAGLDEPDDPQFCIMDGCTVHDHQICKDWENDA